MNRKIGTILSGFSKILQVFTALFITPLIIRTLGQSQYGIYTLVLSIASYLSVLDLGIGNSVVKFMSKFRANNDIESQRKYLGVTCVYYIIISCVMLVIGVILYILFPNFFSKGLSFEEISLARKLLVLSILNIIITIGTSGFFYTTVAYENFYISNGWPLITSVLQILLTLICLLRGCSCYDILLIQVICNIITRVITICFVFFKMKICPTLRNVDGKFISSILSYSILIFLQMIAAQINSATDQVLIGALVVSSSTILGVYGVAAQINHYFQNFGGVINGVIMPGIIKQVEFRLSSENIKNEMVRIGRLNLMFVGIVFIVFLINGKQFVLYWAGSENSSAYYVALFLMIPYIFIITQDVGLKFLWAYNKQKFLSIAKLIIVALNVVLTIFLIKWNPLIGATIGTFISLIIGDVILMQIIFKKELGIKLLEYYKGLFSGILFSLVCAFLIGLLFKMVPIREQLSFIINCILMVGIYVLILYFYGFNKYEKQLIKNMFSKVFKWRV